jgi:hypothetical protein
MIDCLVSLVFMSNIHITGTTLYVINVLNVTACHPYVIGVTQRQERHCAVGALKPANLARLKL